MGNTSLFPISHFYPGWCRDVWEEELYYPYPLSNSGLFIYACACTPLCTHAGVQTHPSPFLRKILFAEERQRKSSKSSIYSEYDFATVTCVIRHGWWSCNITNGAIYVLQYHWLNTNGQKKLFLFLKKERKSIPLFGLHISIMVRSHRCSLRYFSDDSC